MSDLNRLTIVCRVGKAPELKHNGTGENMFASTAVHVVNNQFNGKEEVGHWFIVEFTGKQAENFCKYMQKGDKVLIDGCIKQRTYTAGDGTKKTFTFIKGFNFTAFKSFSQQQQPQQQPVEPVKAPKPVPQPTQYEAMPYDELTDISF